MDKKKLGINTAAGVLAIIGAVIFPVSWPIITTANIGSNVANMVGESGIGSMFSGVAMFFSVYAMIVIGSCMIGMVQSKQVGIKTTGHILGIIGGLYFIVGPFLNGITAMVLMILTAVFCLKQAPVEISATQKEQT